ncbi:hypothetical protein [Larkinella harenae]
MFIVVLMLGFGFLSSNEHIALAAYAVHDFLFLGGYLILWLLYAAYAIRFSWQLFQTTDLLQLFRLVPTLKRVFLLYLLHLQLLAPVLFYAGFMLWVGNQQDTTVANAVIILAMIILTILPLPFVDYALRHPNPERFTGNLGAWLRQRLTTPYGLFFIRYLFREQPATLLLAKTGSCLLTIGLLAVYPTDDYDIRLFTLGMLLAATFHAGLVFELYQFEATQLLLLRNLPIPIRKRWGHYVGIVILCTSPEAILLIYSRPDDLSLLAIIGIWAFELSLLLLQYTSLLTRHTTRDRFLQRLFWPAIGLFLLIMYRLPVWSLAGGGSAVAFFLFIRNYDRSFWEEEL